MSRGWHWASLVLLLIGCSYDWTLPENAYLSCEDSECPTGYTCEVGEAGPVCVSSNTQAVPVCGDGVTSGDEYCDDGSANTDGYNPAGGERCNATCTGFRGFCGDGVRDVGFEECDPATGRSDSQPNTCRLNCTNPVCGDGILDDDFNEVCDEADANADGYNIEGGERCNASCSGYRGFCGDGILNEGFEECDPESGLSDTESNACRRTCTNPVCGDGILDDAFNEFCDDGDANSDSYSPDSGERCNATCSGYRGFCGDGVVDQGEACDDGDGLVNDCPYTLTSCEVCYPSCELGPGNANTCGDGDLDAEAGEICDDGDIFNQLGTCWGNCLRLNTCGLLGQERTLGTCSAVGTLRTDPGQFIALGRSHGCAVDEYGSVHCWGDNSRGQTDIPDDMDAPVIQVVAGMYHACALLASGEVRCWGPSASDGCADNSGCGQADVPETLPPVTRLAAGLLQTAAIDANGMLHCWGDPTENTSEYKIEMLDCPDQGIPVIDVALGKSHSCLVRSDGSVECWGRSDYGQTSPPSDLGPVVSVSVGNWHSCAIEQSGVLRCWGQNSQQQIAIPPDITGASFSDAGSSHTCVIGDYGTVRCWGRGDYGQTAPPGNLLWTQALALAEQASCALSRDNLVTCWGDDDSTGVSRQPFKAFSMGAGEEHACVVTPSGRVECWGQNAYGQAKVPSKLGRVVQLGLGQHHTCALVEDGSLRCWGAGGDASDCATVSRVQCGQSMVPPDLPEVVEVQAGGFHTCARHEDGTLSCWGRGTERGHCGYDQTLDAFGYECGQSDIPEDLGPIVGLTLGYLHTCAVKADGQVVCWGAGNDNDEADGSTFRDQAKVPVDLTGVVSVSAGMYFTCALKNDGLGTCWGRVPVELESVTDLNGMHLAAGDWHLCVSDSSGEVQCWGDGAGSNYGQTNVPEDLGLASSLSAGGEFSCALLRDQSVRCWGTGDALDDCNTFFAACPANSPVDSPLRVGFSGQALGVVDGGTGLHCDTAESYVLRHPASRASDTRPTFGCRLSQCGNGYIEGNEVCDDGNQEDGDRCTSDCSEFPTECGDGVREGAEVCDDGNTFDGDFCSADCANEVRVCGDGYVASGEACDDGNIDDGDGCSSICEVQAVCNTDTDLGSSVGPLVAQGTTLEAQNDYVYGPSTGAPDLAYGWEAPQTGSYTFDTAGSEFDTFLQVLTTDCAVLEFNDDAGGSGATTSSITLDVNAGDLVIIVVDGYGSAAGDFILNITQN